MPETRTIDATITASMAEQAEELKQKLEKLHAASSEFLKRYDSLPITHDSYGLFTARNNLAYFLKTIDP